VRNNITWEDWGDREVALAADLRWVVQDNRDGTWSIGYEPLGIDGETAWDVVQYLSRWDAMVAAEAMIATLAQEVVS
jgi:hypothetical protein